MSTPHFGSIAGSSRWAHASPRPFFRGFLTHTAITGVLLLSVEASAFPPYRSTDAAPADPWELEPRLGLFQLVRDEGVSEWTSPLLRMNLGFPANFEVLTEVEAAPEKLEPGEAAAGVKWVPLRRQLALGVEAIALLPLPSRPGAGLETTAIASWFANPLRLHLNIGGFLDGRGEGQELGHKASVLSEVETGPLRPGIELAMKSVRHDSTQVAIGAGAIWTLGPIDLRAGLHLGVNDAAEDVRASFWVTSKVPLASE